MSRSPSAIHTVQQRSTATQAPQRNPIGPQDHPLTSARGRTHPRCREFHRRGCRSIGACPHEAEESLSPSPLVIKDRGVRVKPASRPDPPAPPGVVVLRAVPVTVAPSVGRPPDPHNTTRLPFGLKRASREGPGFESPRFRSSEQGKRIFSAPPPASPRRAGPQFGSQLAPIASRRPGSRCRPGWFP